MYDLLLKGGTVIDPCQGIERTMSVAVKQGKIARLGENIDEKEAKKTLHLYQQLVCPGLIDLHTHVYWGGTPLGVVADSIGLRSGVTTFVDAGSSGAANFLGFKEHIIKKSTCQIFAFLNISYPGIFGFSADLMYGESQHLELLNVPAAVKVGKKYPQFIKGIKVRESMNSTGNQGLHPMHLAMRAAEELRKPLMVHIGKPPPDSRQILSFLREGDIITHAFRGNPNGLLDEKGYIAPELIEARKRGVIVDLGHGMGSLSFHVAEKMMEQGFFCDTISSDVHALSAGGPAFDLPTTMSKMLNLGMPLSEVVRATTYKPALVLAEEDQIGHLQPGSIADIAVLELRQGKFEFYDGFEHKMVGNKRLFPILTCKEGKVFKALSSDSVMASQN
ncbi:Deacetylase [subsurface metagenome]